MRRRVRKRAKPAARRGFSRSAKLVRPQTLKSLRAGSSRLIFRQLVAPTRASCVDFSRRSILRTTTRSLHAAPLGGRCSPSRDGEPAALARDPAVVAGHLRRGARDGDRARASRVRLERWSFKRRRRESGARGFGAARSAGGWSSRTSPVSADADTGILISSSKPMTAAATARAARTRAGASPETAPSKAQPRSPRARSGGARTSPRRRPPGRRGPRLPRGGGPRARSRRASRRLPPARRLPEDAMRRPRSSSTGARARDAADARGGDGDAPGGEPG